MMAKNTMDILKCNLKYSCPKILNCLFDPQARKPVMLNKKRKTKKTILAIDLNCLLAFLVAQVVKKFFTFFKNRDLDYL